ncbi:hypothetical protein [Rummeliibacillus pycnus]|uniref:hypothetical protein n=1 Tax=Rummeliibacillus pycnus TaxID=101070 RepID=UPI003D2D1226
MKIKTYIYIREEDKFINIKKKEEIKEIIAIKKDVFEDGLLNLDGVIVFENGVHGKIEDFEAYDDIDSLWYFYKNALENFLENGEGEIYFPNTPIEIKFEKKNKSNLLLSVDEQLLVSETKEFIEAFYEKGNEFAYFLDYISDYTYKSDFRRDLEKLKKYR